MPNLQRKPPPRWLLSQGRQGIRCHRAAVHRDSMLGFERKCIPVIPAVYSSYLGVQAVPLFMGDIFNQACYRSVHLCGLWEGLYPGFLLFVMNNINTPAKADCHQAFLASPLFISSNPPLLSTTLFRYSLFFLLCSLSIWGPFWKCILVRTLVAHWLGVKRGKTVLMTIGLSVSAVSTAQAELNSMVSMVREAERTRSLCQRETKHVLYIWMCLKAVISKFWSWVYYY